MGAYYTTAISNTIPSYSNVSVLKQQQQVMDRSCRAEFDTHADTCGVNNIARIISYTGKTAHVSPFTPDLEKIRDVPIVKAAIAYDDSITGETYVVIINQALYFDTALPHILLNPNQMRAYGIQVDDVPKHLSKGTSSHSIFFEDENIRIPLLLNGCISYFNVRTPSDKEISQCLHLNATSESIDWEPYSSCFAELEEAFDEPKRVPMAQTNISYLASGNPEICDTIEYNLNSSSMKTSNKDLYVKPKELASKWAIGPNLAEATVKATTQKFIRSAVHPIDRRFRTRNTALKYNSLNCRFTSDTFFASTPSILRNTCAQLFMSDFGFGKFCPQRLKSEAGFSLQEFLQDIGIPRHIHTDVAKEMTLGTWQKVCKEAGIKTSTSEPYSPWQNRTEVEIRELKRHVRRLMSRTQTPKQLWDFCTLYTTDLRNRIVRPLRQQHGRTPYEILTGNTPDISEFLEFEWYQPVWYYEPTAFPEQRKHLARWIGVAHRVGQAMCYWLLPESGIPIARTSIQPIASDEINTDTFREILSKFNQQIGDKLKMTNDPIQGFQLYREDIDEDLDNDIIEPDPPLNTEEDVFDQLLLAQPLLNTAEGKLKAKIIGRKRDEDGNVIGTYHNNPILNTTVYLAEFPDGTISEYAANIIAEAIYNQVDDEGHDNTLFEAIIGHEFQPQTLKDSLYNSPNDSVPVQTTEGWKICLQWVDGSTSWHPMNVVKNSFPIQLADYAVTHNLQDEQGFFWWIKHTLKKRDCIISSIHTRYAKRTHKFGIQVPMTVEEALAIDKATNTTFWHDAIKKEMKNVMVAFRFLDPDAQSPIGYKWIKCHMIFDIKMDFTRKARFVAGGHMTNPPTSLTYSSVVSRDSVRIAFLLAALNDIELLAADVGNAYLNAPTKEQVYTTAGPEFGPELQGRLIIIVRALYGLKSSGAAWRAHLANTLHTMGFTSSLADPDVWFRPATKPNGFQYYEYILAYVDDILALSHDPHKILFTLSQFYRLKEGYDKPTRYLGAQVKEWRFPDDAANPKWALSSEQYVKEAIHNVETSLAKQNRYLKKYKQPFSNDYYPELDTSPLLDDEETNYYQSQISVLRWMVELGRIDIYINVALLSSFLVQPRRGHMEAIYSIYGYLKHHNRSTMVFDDAMIDWKDTDFSHYDWTDFYHEAKENIPPNAPVPRGNPVQINAFVDANHARNRVTRRSHTGILIYLNTAPILWYSKAQTTVETSTFGSEFVAMRIAVDLIEGLRYKLRMFGVPIDGPANVLSDNMAVIQNSTIPSSTIKKKHNAICYHRVREAVASGIIRIAKIDTKENLADLFTKPLPAALLHHLMQRILY